MFPRKLRKLARALLLAAGPLGLVAPEASATGALPLTIPVDVSVIEGSGEFQMTFQVTNNTAGTLLLDYAYAAITPLGPDPDDMASFAGVGGSNGLAGANLFILAGGTGTFTYNVFTPNPPDGTDFGRNRFDFTAEFQTYNGPLNTLPNPNNISSAIGVVSFLGQNSIPFAEDPVVLNTLLNFNPLPFGSTLFQNTTPGVNPTDGIFMASSISSPGDPNPFDNSPIITVRDIDAVPEPTSLVMSCTAILCLLGYRGYRRLRPSPDV